MAAEVEESGTAKPEALVVVGDVVGLASEIGPSVEWGIPEFLACAPLRATA